MATTPNFNWSTPDNTGLVKNGALDIRTLGDAIDASLVDLKGGTTGQVLAKATNTDMDFTWTTVSAGTTEINPNLIINGNFTINQRAYVSAANLASGAYGFDRWKSSYTNTTLTFTSAPAGQSVTINTSGVITQIVEQSNVPAGTYTLSWSGTATGRIYNSGAGAPSYAASPVTFTADGLANVVVEFTASGSTKTLSKIKLESGSTETAYSYAGGTFDGELAACQRYYYRVAGSTAYNSVGLGYGTSTTNISATCFLPVTMRTAPASVDYSAPAVFDGTTLTSSSALALNSGESGVGVATLNCTIASGGSQYRPYKLCFNNNTAGYVGFSAEL